MARLARVVAVDVPHHITQRGNNRSYIFDSDSDRLVYLELLHRACRLYEIHLIGHCLMTNHIHLVAVPGTAESLALTLKWVHCRYATYWNARMTASGHVWQGRYYSCPLDRTHLWAALRYTENNPVRARLCATADDYLWSSAPAHCGESQDGSGLDFGMWADAWTPQSWREYLSAGVPAEETDSIRRHTHTGRPLGDADFVRRLEELLGRQLAPEVGGRPAKQRVAMARGDVAPFG